MNLTEINDTGWYEHHYGYFGDGMKRKFDKIKKFHFIPKKINGKLYWLKYSYYIRQTIEPHIIYYVGKDNSPRYEYIQIRKKDYHRGKPHEIYCIYEKLGNLKKV
jgi:hypothetical protein